MHPLGPSAYSALPPQVNMSVHPYAHLLEANVPGRSLQSEPVYIDSHRSQMAELQRRLSVDAFNPALASYNHMPVTRAPFDSSAEVSTYDLDDRTVDRQRYLPASLMRQSLSDGQPPAPLNDAYERQATSSSVRSDDEPYIDITGNSTPMPLRSPVPGDSGDLDAEGESERGTDSLAPSRRGSQQSDSFATHIKFDFNGSHDLHSASSLKEPGAIGASEKAGAKRGKSSTPGAKAGTKRAPKKVDRTNAAPRKKKVVDRTVPKKPRAPKQPKRSRKDSIMAAELGEKATLDLALLQQELRAAEHDKGAGVESEKPDTLLQLLHATAMGRKRKRVDYAALVRGAEGATRSQGDGDGEDSGGSNSPSGSTPNPGSPKPSAAAAASQASDDRNRVYCICRKPFDGATDDEFYIGCEGCDEWFHGRCVNVTEQEASGIEQWMCAACEARGLVTLRKIVCAAPGCGKYVEPDSSPASLGNVPTSAATTAGRPTHHFPRPPPPWVPTGTHRRRYCSQPCALSTARTVLRDRVAPPLRILAPPPREEQAVALEAHERLAQWCAVQEADRADKAALARFETDLALRRAGLCRLTRRRDRIRGAIVAARNLHPAAVAAPDCETVALVDRLCGYDFRIAGEWVVDLDDDEGECDFKTETLDADDADAKAVLDVDGETTTTGAPVCLAKGRCPLHEGWDSVKHAEVELDIDEAVTGIRNLLNRRRALVRFMVAARRKPPSPPPEVAAAGALVVK
ncbi:hypothetical protein HDU86_000647 [Geranomyces michiganensis]|nr:hypothetical protein HDU86_000647 [Geranomyces michiganensis]